MSSFSASLSPRAASAGRWASKMKGWPWGSGSSSTHTGESQLLEPLLAPERAHLVEPPDEIDAALERGHEPRAVVSPGVALERELPQAGEPLRGRVDGRGEHVSKRALGVGRERPDRLDLVPEQVDPQRLAPGRGEHVEQPAADGELAALLDALDAFVAGVGELLGQSPEARYLTRAEPQHRRALPRRRHRLGQGECRGADETSGREHLERPRALAHQVGRWPQARADADAARGQERHRLLAGEPADRLGQVARVGVVGHEHREPAAELGVEGGEQQR